MKSMWCAVLNNKLFQDTWYNYNRHAGTRPRAFYPLGNHEWPHSDPDSHSKIWRHNPADTVTRWGRWNSWAWNIESLSLCGWVTESQPAYPGTQWVWRLAPISTVTVPCVLFYILRSKKQVSIEHIIHHNTNKIGKHSTQGIKVSFSVTIKTLLLKAAVEWRISTMTERHTTSRG